MQQIIRDANSAIAQQKEGNMQKGKKSRMPAIVIIFMACSVIYRFGDFVEESPSEEDCEAQANAGGIISPQCLELAVFREWYKKGAESLLVEAPAAASEAPVKVGKSNAAVVVDEFGETFSHSIAGEFEGLEKQFSQLVVSGVHLDVKYDTEHVEDSDESKMLKRVEDKKERLARLEETEKEVRASLEVSNSITPWAHDLQDLMDHMQHELDDHKGVQHDEAQALKAHPQVFIDKVEAALQTAQGESNGTAPWFKDFKLMKSRLAYNMAVHAEKFHGADANADQKAQLAKLEQSITAHGDQSHDTPWAKDLKKMQQRMEFELHTHAHRHHEPAGAVDEAAHWGRTSASEKGDPLAKWADDLEDVHSTHEQLQTRHKERVARRAQLKDDIARTMDKLDQGLSDLVSDRKAWESTFLQKYGQANTDDDKQPREIAVPKKTFLANQLKWSNVPSSPPSKIQRAVFLEASQKQPTVVHKDDVWHLHWTGELPKVAAVAWIRGGRKTKSRMTYFVDNFRLQDYEGHAELVLVHHSNDTAAAGILRQYVNSTDVKVVAAHDSSQNTFPSDPALRFAAWSSDADVVAQWDFDEWHDPSRLSAQIRAMAYKAKRACVLSVSSTTHKLEDEDKEVSLSSVVGTRTWMKAHWHPFSKSRVEASQLVELDMQNKDMMSKISRIEHVNSFGHGGDPADAPQTAHGQVEHGIEDQMDDGTKFSRDIKECLDYDHSQGQAADDAAEKAIRENVGPEFGKRFHDLVKKRHDITSKLQLLCFQTSMETDAGKRKSMHEHVIEMDHIRAELDKHVRRLASVFGVASP